MTRITVRNVGVDFIATPSGRLLHANAVEVFFKDVLIPLPAIVPNQLELGYARRARLGNYEIQAFQHVEAINFNIDFRLKVVKDQITKNFKNQLSQNPGLLGDLFLQHREDYPIKESHRTAYHEMQLVANSSFLSDIEVNREQSATDFITQILELQDEFPNKVIRPILDVGMRKNGLFQEKVNLLIKNKFPTFTVRFRALKRSFKNWIGLSDIIAGQNVWCNVAGTTRRWFGKKKISQIVPLFQLGVHSVSHGNLRAYGGFKVQPFLLDRTTFCYNPAPSTTTYAESRADDIFTHEDYSAWSRAHIRKRDFYSDFCKSKSGMKHALQLLHLLS